MKIWIDADACPVAIKEILFRAAQRREISITLVANQLIAVPPSPFINALQVSTGFDVADNEIFVCSTPAILSLLQTFHWPLRR